MFTNWTIAFYDGVVQGVSHSTILVRTSSTSTAIFFNMISLAVSKIFMKPDIFNILKKNNFLISNGILFKFALYLLIRYDKIFSKF